MRTIDRVDSVWIGVRTVATWTFVTVVLAVEIAGCIALYTWFF